MSGRLSLNTSNIGGNQRYSFLATPLEMRAGHEDVEQPPLPAESDTLEARQQTTTTEYSQSKSITDERAQDVKKHQENLMTSPYPGRPPPEEHPANYAPYAEDAHQQEKDYAIQATQYSYNAPPHSPEPLPVKAGSETLDETRNGYPATVAPDVNPLHSPQLPRSPPPIATTPAPAALPSDIAAYHHPGQVSHPNQGIKGGTWSHDLCDCSGLGTCCLGLLCPCILYGRTQHRLSKRSRKEDPTDMLGHELCNGSCAAMAVLCGCQWIMATVQHTRTRKAYGIRGNMVSDCVRATCCTCCTLIQDEKEIQKREGERMRAVRGSGAVFAEPYVTPGPMAYPPPVRVPEHS